MGAPYYTRLCFVATRDTVRTRFQDICMRYGVRDQDGNPYKVTTHQFRHNGITDRLAAGFTAAQIADMTGHHGDAMIYNAYAHLDLKPETIVEKQKFVSGEPGSRDERYILFGGRILNMNEQLETRLLKTCEHIEYEVGFVVISLVVKVTCGTAWSANSLYLMRNREIIILNKLRYGKQSRRNSANFLLFEKMQNAMLNCLNAY